MLRSLCEWALLSCIIVPSSWAAFSIGEATSAEVVSLAPSYHSNGWVPPPGYQPPADCASYNLEAGKGELESTSIVVKSMGAKMAEKFACVPRYLWGQVPYHLNHLVWGGTAVATATMTGIHLVHAQGKIDALKAITPENLCYQNRIGNATTPCMDFQSSVDKLRSGHASMNDPLILAGITSVGSVLFNLLLGVSEHYGKSKKPAVIAFIFAGAWSFGSLGSGIGLKIFEQSLHDLRGQANAANATYEAKQNIEDARVEVGVGSTWAIVNSMTVLVNMAGWLLYAKPFKKT